MRLAFSAFILTVIIAEAVPSLASASSVPDFLWTRQSGGTRVAGKAIAVDAAGNVCVAGRFDNSLDSWTNVASQGASDIFVVKFDRNGTPLWSSQGGSGGMDEVACMALDPDGNIYVTGIIGAAATFGTNSVPLNGSSDMYVMKCDPNGHFFLGAPRRR